MSRELLETADLGEKLGWNEFDFEVDPDDPLLDDLEGLLATGQPAQEALSSLFMMGLERHVGLPMRLKLLHELERRLAGEVRLDVRAQGATVLRALQHLALPVTSIGLVWHLYPPYMVARLQERLRRADEEEARRTSVETALEEELKAGTGDVAALASVEERALPVLERILLGWSRQPPPNLALAKSLIELAARFPGQRAARALASVLWARGDPELTAAVGRAMTAMPEAAREIIHHHLNVHDPPPETRRGLYAAALALKDLQLMTVMVQDALGGGPWTVTGNGPEHARAVLGAALETEDRRAVPAALHAMADRPPKADVRAAVLEAFAASPLADEFQAGLKRLEEGEPVTVRADVTREDFLRRHGSVNAGMTEDQIAEEARRVQALWDDCYHQRLGWLRPREAQGAIGLRERELLRRLDAESRAMLGRLAGTPQVALLEREFRMKWLATPQNDISGRTPLAIILDERAEHAEPEQNRLEREAEAKEIYAMACRAQEAKIADDARRYASAVLQILPDHPFARDFLERLDRGLGVGGVDERSESPGAPRIIIPS